MSDFDRLHELQEQLLAAQNVEDAAMAELATYTKTGGSDLDKVHELMAATTRAHTIVTSLYAAWKVECEKLRPRI